MEDFSPGALAPNLTIAARASRVLDVLRTPILLSCLAILAACGGNSSPGSTANGSGGSTPPTPASLALSASTYSIQQSAGAVTVTVARTGGTTSAASVQYATANQTAIAGTDYTSATGTLSWSGGDTTSKSFTVTVNSAPAFSGNKSFTVALSAAGANTTIGTPATATMTITGSTTTPPPAAAGALQFSAATYSVGQGAGTVTVAVNRVSGSGGAVTVSYSTASGSAVAGTDFTAASGTLSWSDGDASAKSLSVPISTTPGFSGTKSFSVTLSAPTGGATLGSPSTAGVTIAGSGAPASGGPSAVTNLQLVNQGGPSNTLTHSQQISWSAATAGSNPISYYNIYRNGVVYATATGLTYTDNSAANSNDPVWATAATVYSYDVSAVDAGGNEGPKSGQMSVWSYRNGKSNWGNNDLSYGTLQENYSSTGGSPQGGTTDISIDFVSGGFQPAVQVPQAPQWDLEIGAFNYFTIDINPGTPLSGEALPFGTVSRLPPGDVYGWHPSVNLYDYGPAPKANTWATYKVPLLTVAMGTCQFTGSISGSTLTVTAIVSGDPLVDAGGFVTGPGVPAGTYITAYGQHSAIGTFTLAGPGISATTTVASTKMTYQRTSLYKFGIQPSVQNTTMYFNNMGFTVN